tara:strand:+ start:8926 stop:9528 length:603 start_codon:yes stop_codon:yes gene_type:complete
MDILITGSTGKIGWALKNKIRELKPEWNVLEFKRTPDSDLKNESDIVRKFLEYNPDVVVHLAVTRNPMEIPRIRDVETMATDTKMLFDLLRYSRNTKRFLYASSCAVYGFEPTDSIEPDFVAGNIIHLIEHEAYSDGYSCVNLSTNNYPTSMEINPYLHEKEHTVINGVSKYINEHILKCWSRENNIPAISMRIFPVKKG